jgi:hypothetical protein
MLSKNLSRVFRETKFIITREPSIRLQSTLAKASETLEIDGLQNEPSGPKMVTEVPGPKSIAMIKEMDSLQVN